METCKQIAAKFEHTQGTIEVGDNISSHKQSVAIRDIIDHPSINYLLINDDVEKQN